MPNYDYKCENCGHQFEQRISYERRFEPELIPCSECGELKLKYGFFSNRGPAFGDPVRLGIRRPDEGFKDRLREIHATTPGSTLKDVSSYI